MNLREQNLFRDKLRDMQLEINSLKGHLDELCETLTTITKSVDEIKRTATENVKRGPGRPRKEQ
jgi:uncharacterized coiled-coil DUF342 family protein